MNKKALTAKEKEVLELILKAKRRKIMANELSISINTLDKHIHHLHIKTSTHSNSELILWAIEEKAMEKHFL